MTAVMNSLPATMYAVVLHTTTPTMDGWRVEANHPIAALGEKDVLIKIAASPLNPSDLSFIQGMYGVRKPLPVVPGFEASGRVVAVGQALDPDAWIGRRVACFSGANGDGTWAEYMLTSSLNVLPVADHIDDEAAAMLLVNPLTVWALIDIAVRHGAKAVVQTAAASALGHMLRRFGESRGLAVISIVRRAALVDELRAGGAQHVLDSSADDFDQQLRGLCRTLGATVAFDAVGGALTDRVLRGMPNGSRIIVYGGLSSEPVTVGVDQLIFRDKKIEGFWLSTWMPQHRDLVAQAWHDVQAQHELFKTDVRARFGLDQFGNALSTYANAMSGGKILIVP